MDVPTIRTSRLLLEPIASRHSAGMFSLWSNEEVCRFSGPIADDQGRPIPSPVQTVADSDKVLQSWLTARDAGWGFRWALTLLESGDFVGTAGFNSVGSCAEYAYHLHPAHWGRGLMSEATVAAFGWAATSAFCVEIEAFIEPDNKKSVALAVRHGFTRAGDGPDGTDRYVRFVTHNPCS